MIRPGGLFAVLSFLLAHLPCAGERPADMNLVPNGTLQVAYRNLEEGKLGNAVYDITLSCWDGRCSLTTLTLNHCMFGKFYPKIELVSTDDGALVVEHVENGVLHLRWGQLATINMIFNYEVRVDPQRSKTWFGQLTGFSGATVKYSEILNKPLSWQLIPLKGRDPIIELDCSSVLLHGVPE